MVQKSHWHAALSLAACALCIASAASAQAPVTYSPFGAPVRITGGNAPGGPALLDSSGKLPADVIDTGSILAAYETTAQADAKYVPFNYGTSGTVLNGEYHFANGGTFTDPATGYAADAKFGNAGLATTFLRVNSTATYVNLAGSGNAYACLSASGVLYRSSTACQ